VWNIHPGSKYEDYDALRTYERDAPLISSSTVGMSTQNRMSFSRTYSHFSMKTMEVD
jgi:hypothetical protein